MLVEVSRLLLVLLWESVLAMHLFCTSYMDSWVA